MKLDISSDLTNVIDIVSTNKAYAALKSDGSVITWGEFNNNMYDGDISGVLNLTDVEKIYSSETTFVALINDGSIYTWGDLSSNTISDLSGEIVEDVYSTFGSDLR